MKNIITKLTTLITVLAVGFTLALPSVAAAQTKEDICQGVGITGGTTGCATPAGSPSLHGTIHTVVNVLSIVVGVIAVIMIIIGGLKYITSSGDSSSVNSAKNTILYAIVGLVVVALAQSIVRFVLTNV